MNSLAAWFAINFTFRSMFSRARPAFDTSFSKAFRVSTFRLFMPPETRITKWNGADPHCGSLMISSVASASRRLRSTDAPDSSNSIKSLRRGSEQGRERQFSVDVKSAAPGVVDCARNTEVFIEELHYTSGTIDQIIWNVRLQYRFPESFQCRH